MDPKPSILKALGGRVKEKEGVGGSVLVHNAIIAGVQSAYLTFARPL